MQPRLTVSSHPFGATSDGQGVDHFTLANEGGIDLSVITYGGIITSVRAPVKGALTRFAVWDTRVGRRVVGPSC